LIGRTRLALAVLSNLTPDAIRRAVFHEQAEVFQRVPGVGKQTAQKILLHLENRIRLAPGLEPVGALSDVDGEVLAQLRPRIQHCGGAICFTDDPARRRRMGAPAPGLQYFCDIIRHRVTETQRFYEISVALFVLLRK
jgi:hypothetical protein